MTGPNTYIECDELDFIVGLVCGELLIVSQCIKSNLVDRWHAHKDENLDVSYIEPGDEPIVYRRA